MTGRINNLFSVKDKAMKVFLRKDIAQVGFAGEIVKVTEGYARNFLFPRDLAVEITAHNEEFYQNSKKF